jgi:hypothetical protein
LAPTQATLSGRPRRFQLSVRFDGRAEQDLRERPYKLVVELHGDPDENGTQLAEIGFLLRSDPDEWLTAGAKFTLFDELDAIAEGEIVGPA